jgi:hypothetical protein
MAKSFRVNWKKLIGRGSDLAAADEDLAVREDIVSPTEPKQLPIFTVATAPTASEWTGAMAYFSNGDAGSAGVAFSDGTTWLNVTTGSGIAIS